MGNQQSPGPTCSDQVGSAGFRIIRCQPGSQARQAALEELFDFIVAVNDQPVSADKTLAAHLQSVEDDTCTLGIYNALRQTARRVVLNRPDWGGPFAIGATVRHEQFDVIRTDTLRVLKVEKDSPADKAGLKGSSDWIMGTSDGMPVADPTALSYYLKKSAEQKICLGLMVYDIETSTVREVMVSPQVDADGNPKLGAELGFGLAHRLRLPTPNVSCAATPLATSSVPEQVSIPSTKVAMAESPMSRKAESPSPQPDMTIDEIHELFRMMAMPGPSLRCALQNESCSLSSLRPPCFSPILLNNTHGTYNVPFSLNSDGVCNIESLAH